MKRTISFVLALILVVSLAACGSKEASAEVTTEATTAPTTEPTTEATAEPFNIEEYKSLVSDCVAEIYDGAVVLSNIVSFEYKYLKIYTNIAGESADIDLDVVVESGIMGLEENSEHTEESVKERYDAISAMYKEIVLCDTDNTEASEIKDIFLEMHEAYVGLHNLAFSPSLNMTTLAANHDEYINTIKNCKNLLDILLS